MDLINKVTHLSVYCHKTHTHARAHKVFDLIVINLYTREKNELIQLFCFFNNILHRRRRRKHSFKIRIEKNIYLF